MSKLWKLSYSPSSHFTHCWNCAFFWISLAFLGTVFFILYLSKLKMQVKQPPWSRHAHGALVFLNANWWEPPKFSQTTAASVKVQHDCTHCTTVLVHRRTLESLWSVFIFGKTEFFCLILSDKAALIRPAFASPKDEQSRTRNLWSDLWKTNPDVKRTTWKKGCVWGGGSAGDRASR